MSFVIEMLVAIDIQFVPTEAFEDLVYPEYDSDEEIFKSRSKLCMHIDIC